jgi:hypothetical protein
MLYYLGDTVEVQRQVRAMEAIQETTVCDCKGDFRKDIAEVQPLELTSSLAA